MEAELGTWHRIAINTKFTALRDTMDKAWTARRGLAGYREEIIADNAVLNRAVTALLDEQVRKMARLHGDAYADQQRQNRLDAARRRRLRREPAQEHDRLQVRDRRRKGGAVPCPGPRDQLLMSLQELKGNARRTQRDRGAGANWTIISSRARTGMKLVKEAPSPANTRQ